MSRAADIYFSETAWEAVAVRTHGNRSAAVSRIIERYDELCRRSLPDLSDAEWGLIRDACRSLPTNTVTAALYLPPQVADAIKADGLDAKWGVDGAWLVAKLQALDYAARIALIDAVEQYWVRAS
jgi:hypothetical protein